MKIKIHRNHLVAKSACEKGLAWFDGFKEEMGVPKNKVLSIEWDAISMVWALSNPESRTWTRWAIEKAILPSWSLHGANLQHAYLTGTNLEGANLEGADLEGASLNGADLRYADLRYAKLEGTDLAEVYLTGANLEGAYYPTGPVPEGWLRNRNGLLTKA